MSDDRYDDSTFGGGSGDDPTRPLPSDPTAGPPQAPAWGGTGTSGPTPPPSWSVPSGDGAPPPSPYGGSTAAGASSAAPSHPADPYRQAPASDEQDPYRQPPPAPGQAQPYPSAPQAYQQPYPGPAQPYGQGYPQPGYGGPSPYPVPTPTPGSAIALTVISAVSMFSTCFLLGLPSIVLGGIALASHGTNPAGAARMTRIGWWVYAINVLLGVLAVVGLVALAAQDPTFLDDIDPASPTSPFTYPSSTVTGY